MTTNNRTNYALNWHYAEQRQAYRDSLEPGMEYNPDGPRGSIGRCMDDTEPQDTSSDAFPHHVPGDEDDSPSGFVRALRAGRDMRGLI